MTSPYRQHCPLDPEVAFLNHGSFGTTPIMVLDYQQKLGAEMEQEPVRFLWRKLPKRLHAARNKLAEFLGAPAEGLAFIR